MVAKIQSNLNRVILKWVPINPSKFEYTKPFLSIIEFYLFNSPVDKINHFSATTLREYGWEKHSLNSLRNVMLFDTNFKKRFHICATLDDLEKIIFERMYYGNEYKFEEFVVCWKNDKNIVESVMYLIRCAFAHRSFRVQKHKNEKYYFFTNIDKGKLKGRAVLKESTLMKWIELIKNGK
jgi:hypothetical protein